MVSVSLDCPFVFVLYLVYPNDVSVSWLSLCLRSVSCVPNGQSRDTDTIGYTRHRTKTKGQSRMDNQETLTPFGHTRHRTKTKGQSKWAIKRHWHHFPCLRPVSCVPKWCQCFLIVHSGLSSSCVLCTQIVSVSSDCPFLIVPLKGTTKNGQSRDTDTIGYTRHRTKTQGQSRMDNQETLTPLGT
jgi:hypothetical protein